MQRASPATTRTLRQAACRRSRRRAPPRARPRARWRGSWSPAAGREGEQHVAAPGTDLDLDRVRIAEERRPERGGGVHCRATGRRPVRGARPPPFRPARNCSSGPRVEHVLGRDPAAAGLVDAEALSVAQVRDAVRVASRSPAGRRRRRRGAGARPQVEPLRIGVELEHGAGLARRRDDRVHVDVVGLALLEHAARSDGTGCRRGDSAWRARCAPSARRARGGSASGRRCRRRRARRGSRRRCRACRRCSMLTSAPASMRMPPSCWSSARSPASGDAACARRSRPSSAGPTV